MSRHRLLAVAGLVLAVALVGCRGEKPAATPPGAKVVVVRPATYPVGDYWEYNGFLAPTETVEVRARIKGFLTRQFFKDGGEVSGRVVWRNGVELYRGDILYQIDKREYITAQAKAKADVARAEADAVKAKAEIDNWEAQIALAKVELQRAEESLSKSVGSKTDVDRAKATLSVNVAEREAAKAQYAANLAAEKSAASALRTADIQLGYTDIHAPISGVIGRTMVDKGNLVGQDGPTLLTTIIRVDRLFAYFAIPERDLLEYQKLGLPHPPKQTVPLEVRLPELGSEWHAGEIDYVEGSVNSGTGTVQVRGVIPNPRRPNSDNRVFLPGFYVHVRVPKGPPRPQLVLPEDTIMTGQEGQYVYVLGADDKVEKRLVNLGPVVWKSPPLGPGEVKPGWSLTNPNPPPAAESGAPPSARRRVNSVVAIVDGLRPEDRVIVEGLQRARPGYAAAADEWEIHPPRK
jgi:multidrug efflux pump subunit AcrA (membrane-fusion protein)